MLQYFGKTSVFHCVLWYFVCVLRYFGKTFVYFGITAFVKAVIAITRGLPPVVTSNSVMVSVDPCDHVKWNLFEIFFKEDLKKFKNCFEPGHANITGEGLFIWYEIHDVTYYIYCHEKYERCSESKWSDWKLPISSIKVSIPEVSACLLHSTSDNKHLLLMPYYNDYRSLSIVLRTSPDS